MSQENLNAISSKRHNLALILIGANLIKIVNKVKFKCLKGLYLHEISFFSLEVKLKNDSPGWHFPGMVLESMTIEWFVSASFFIIHSILSLIMSGCIESFLVLLVRAFLVIESALYFLLHISLIAVVIRLSIVTMLI